MIWLIQLFIYLFALVFLTSVLLLCAKKRKYKLKKKKNQKNFKKYLKKNKNTISTFCADSDEWRTTNKYTSNIFNSKKHFLDEKVDDSDSSIMKLDKTEVGTFPILTINHDKKGDVIYVQSKLRDGSNGLHVTGNISHVMMESVRVAAIAAIDFLKENKPGVNVNNKELFVHFVPAETYKDGSSGGAAILTSLLATLLETPSTKNIAIMGQLDLHYNIISVGGLKYKTKAAKEIGCTTLIIPLKMQKQWNRLKAEHKQGIDPVFVKTYNDVFPLLFPTLKKKNKY